jgi:hypothetical protein
MSEPHKMVVECSVCHVPVTLITDPGTTREEALIRLAQRRAGWTVIDGELICPDPHTVVRMSPRGLLWGLLFAVGIWFVVSAALMLIIQIVRWVL